MAKQIIGSLLISLLLLPIMTVIGSSSSSSSQRLKLWPMPKQVSHGNNGTKTTVVVAKDVRLETKYDDVSGILREAFENVVKLINLPHSNLSLSQPPPSSYSLLQALNVVVLSDSEELQYGVDESYNLSIPSPELYSKPVTAYLQAKTVYGALHGLQTFSQLCQYSVKTRAIEIHMAPWTIIDKPRFSYRGLLIDTSRHYLPIPVIKNVIDSMTYAKLNVLHWHIVDSQSFPLEIPSYPKLWDGSYSESERYTIADATEIESYARKRGINVLAEIDVPGHAMSWGVGYPALWPSKTCKEPLDVSNEFTFKLIDGILSDFSKIFKFKFVHLGGDEVNTTCWATTPRIKKWLQKQGMNESKAYEYFVLRAQKLALSHGYEIVNWEETFSNFGNRLNPKTVVHNWLDIEVPQKAVAAGFRVIVSNQDKWYLDHLDADWEGFYSNEPLTNIKTAEQQRLVIGGEVCMWGEHIDASDIEQTIWPRAAAAAERLWTAYDKLAKDPSEVAGRLSHFRCLLNQRGVAAAPLRGFGRDAPEEPGSCFSQ